MTSTRALFTLVAAGLAASIVGCSDYRDSGTPADGTATTPQCPNAARPQAGNCPVGFVAPASSAGADCNAACRAS